jgi:hypothetical protein
MPDDLLSESLAAKSSTASVCGNVHPVTRDFPMEMLRLISVNPSFQFFPSLDSLQGAVPMPRWTNSVPDTTSRFAFDLKRTPPDRPIVGIITSAKILGAYTHFWGGRTVPCEEPHCPACEEGMPSRWHCYVGFLCPKTRDHCIFECTGRAARAFEDYTRAHATLRGCHFMAVRPKRRKNARVEITVKPYDLTKITLPPEIDIIRALCTIWQIPSEAIDAPLDDPTNPNLKILPGSISLMRQPATHGNGKKTK